ncbi:hypothetical protein ACIA8G_03380 [Lentzea sp. NPDC051213]|uniref:hypothetical protein n=1 Tax=Lentzea sp. NPDC051213 TaxID=3364126 RepID=UPI0037B8CD9C
MKRLIVLALLLSACQQPPPPVRPPDPAPPPSKVAEQSWQPNAAAVDVQVDGEYAWALRGNGTDLSGGTARTNTESMIKVWIALDFVASRRSVVSPADESALAKMIRDSDDQIAQRFYLQLGGDASVRRLIGTCRLADTRITPGWWSKTTVSAMDAARLGECLVDGPGISPEWRDKLVAMMRDIASDGRFGIPEAPALQGKPLAIKNGWTLHTDTWTVTCLAVWDGWSLAVLVRFKDRPGGHRYGAEVCATVADQLFKTA